MTRLVQRRLQLRLSLDEPPAVPHEITLDEKVAELEAHLHTAGPGGTVAVRPLLLAARSRAEVVVTFMAVLERLRRRRVVAEQDAAFGEIHLRVLGSGTP